MTPVVIGLYLLLYIGIAFKTEDALMALIEIARSNVLLIALFALIPLNRLLRLMLEISEHLAGRRLLAGNCEEMCAELFDEDVTMTEVSSPFADVERRLTASGYSTRNSGCSLAAWRGISAFPARVLFLAATLLLFSGVLISLGGRTSYRGAIIEGEPLPALTGPAGVIERITLEPSTGLFLSKVLTMTLAPVNAGEAKQIFGLYPPSRYRGAFVYPRYLGIGLYYKFSAHDLPGVHEAYDILSIHPPGKEDSRTIPGSPYRIVFSLAQPGDGSDPYMTGRMDILFKVMKGNVLLFTGSANIGGEFSRDGIRLAFPEIRRVVLTDFISDQGVFMVWGAMLLYVVALLLWLPVRCCFPRQEMVFVKSDEGILYAGSRAEGGGRWHAGIFHEALDLLEEKRHSNTTTLGK